MNNLLTHTNQVQRKELDEAELEFIYTAALSAVPVEQIAAAIGLEIWDLKERIKDTNDPVSIKYNTGNVELTIAYRQMTIQAAKNGSNPAQKELAKMLTDANNSLA